MNTSKKWIVILMTDAHGPVYLGSLDVNATARSSRSGVRKLGNATRFTRTGAARVARGYETASVAHESDPPQSKPLICTDCTGPIDENDECRC